MVPVFSSLFAIGLPVFALWKHGRTPLKHPYIFSIGSFAFCAFAMIAEILTIQRRLFAGDIGGIEDTIGAVLMICAVLVAVTLVLNLLLLGLTYTDRE